MPDILYEAAPTDAWTATLDNWANVTGYSTGSITPANNSVVLLMATVPVDYDAEDASLALRFHNGTAQIGPDIYCAYLDNTNEYGYGSLFYAYVADGNAITITVQGYSPTNTDGGDTVRDATRDGQFQVIEFTSDEATLSTTGALTTAATSPAFDASYANITDHTRTFTPASDSIALMISSVPCKPDGGDSSSHFQFGVAGSELGYGRTLQGYDKYDVGGEEIEGADGSAMLAVTCTGSEMVFSRMWKEGGVDEGSDELMKTDTGRSGYFQVIEIKKSFLRHNDNCTGGNAVPDAWATCAGMAGTAYTPASTSVNLMIATVAADQNSGSGDACTEGQFYDGTSRIGPEGVPMYRDLDEAPAFNRYTMAFATEASTSKTYGYQHQMINAGAKPTVDDLAINGRLQVIECIVAAAGGDTTVTLAGADPLTVSPQVPTVATGASSSPAADTLTVAPQVPTVGTSALATLPSADTLTVTPNAPTTASGKTISPGTDTLVVTPNAPTPRTGVTIGVPTDSLAVTPNAPVAASGSLVSPGTDTLTVNPQAPSVSIPTQISLAGADSLSVTPNAPTARTGVTVSPGADSLVVSPNAPALNTGVRIAMAVDSLAVAPQVPVSASGASVALSGADTLVVSPNAPVITAAGSGNVQITVLVDTLLINHDDPTIGTGVIVDVPVNAIAGAGSGVPTVTGHGPWM